MHITNTTIRNFKRLKWFLAVLEWFRLPYLDSIFTGKDGGGEWLFSILSFDAFGSIFMTFLVTLSRNWLITYMTNDLAINNCLPKNSSTLSLKMCLGFIIWFESWFKTDDCDATSRSSSQKWSQLIEHSKNVPLIYFLFVCRQEAHNYITTWKETNVQ